MKVLIVSKAFVSSMYRRKLDALAALGADITAVAPPDWREAGSRQLLERSSHERYRLIVSPIRLNGHFHLYYYPELARIIQLADPDIVHLDEEPYNLATYLGQRAASRRHVPTVFFSWQNLSRRYPPPFSLLERAAYRAASGAIAGTNAVASVLRGKGYHGPLAVIPQFGVDVEHFYPASSPPAGFRVGFLNRLNPAKGPLLALEAFSRLPGDAMLEIVGDGPMRAELQAAADRLALTSRVTIRNRVPSGEVPALMRTLHVLLLPSITTSRWKEQFGRVLVEAMSSGVPVLGSDSGEIPRVLADAGLVFPEGDAGALGDELLRLYHDPALRRELAHRGRERAVEHFSNERIAKDTYAFYQEILDRGGEAQAVICSASDSSSGSSSAGSALRS